jgi:hypothetical protein
MSTEEASRRASVERYLEYSGRDVDVSHGAAEWRAPWRAPEPTV